MTLQIIDNLWELKVNDLFDSNIARHSLGVFSHPYLIVKVSSDFALESWRQGGSIGQGINFEAASAYGEIKPLTLESLLLFQFPLLTGDNYELYYFSLPRLEAVQLQVWEYSGQTIDASISQLVNALESADLSNLQVDTAEINQQLAEINASIQYLENLMSGNNGVPLSVDSDGRLVFSVGEADTTLANYADLGNSPVTNTGGGKTLLQGEKTYYVRNTNGVGHSGETEENAFGSIEEALIILSAQYEIAGHLIINLDAEHDLVCGKLPNFTGAGKITFLGNSPQTVITFVQQGGVRQTTLSNWAGLELELSNINFVKGECQKFLIEGGKMRFIKVDFDQLNVELEDCRSTYLERCANDQNSSSFSALRSVLHCFKCNFIAKFTDSQLTFENCVFYRSFLIESCTVTLQNPRLDHRYSRQTGFIFSSIIQFKSSWLTFDNAASGQIETPLLSCQNCIFKDFPSNIDIGGKKKFKSTGILRLINCTTPETFNNASYDLSNHSFSSGAAAIQLVNSAMLKDITINGGGISRDDFSILADTNYDNSQTNIPAKTLQQAIDYLWERIT